MKKFAKYLKVFNIYDNNTSKGIADDIAAVLSHNMYIQELNLGGDNLQSAVAIKTAKGLQNTSY